MVRVARVLSPPGRPTRSVASATSPLDPRRPPPPPGIRLELRTSASHLPSQNTSGVAEGGRRAAPHPTPTGLSALLLTSSPPLVSAGVGPDLRPQEDGRRRLVLQEGARPDQDQRLPDRAGGAGGAAVQGVRADPPPRPRALRQHGHPHPREGWRLHVADLRHPPGHRQVGGRLLPEMCASPSDTTALRRPSPRPLAPSPLTLTLSPPPPQTSTRPPRRRSRRSCRRTTAHCWSPTPAAASRRSSAVRAPARGAKSRTVKLAAALLRSGVVIKLVYEKTRISHRTAVPRPLAGSCAALARRPYVVRQTLTLKHSLQPGRRPH